jgi:hypothetical protein
LTGVCQEKSAKQKLCTCADALLLAHKHSANRDVRMCVRTHTSVLQFFLFFLKKTKNTVFFEKNAKKNKKTLFFLKVAQFSGT